MKLKEKFIRFMSGRNGFDALVYGVAVLYLILAMVNAFASSYVIHALMIITVAYMFFRVFSKNIYKRQSENQKFLAVLKKVKNSFKVFGLRFKEFKTHRYRKCPHCKNTLRLARRKGTNTVNCPCCHQKFDVKILF